MCGRARCTLRPEDIPRATYRGGQPRRTVNMDRYRPSFNVSPGSNLPVVRRDEGSDGGNGDDAFVVQCMKWGLIPSFTKKTEKPDHYRMFNARSESINEKASFRRLIPKCRCLVSVEGFYEWKKDGSKKQPYYIHFKDGRPLVFAALYDSWKNSEGEIIDTFTILTTSASSALQWLHDRMPIIFGDKESADKWLIGSSSPNLNVLLKPYEEPDLAWYPVTPAMGKPSFDGPECIKEIQVKTQDKNAISKFFKTKETKKEEAKGDEERSPQESIKIDMDTEFKVEPKVEDSHEVSSPADKSSIPKLLDDLKGQHQVKRDYEEFSIDPNQGTYETHTKCTSPVKKKRELTRDCDKQPTLFSYFNKK